MDKKVIEAGKFNRQTDSNERDKLLLKLLREVFPSSPLIFPYLCIIS